MRLWPEVAIVPVCPTALTCDDYSVKEPHHHQTIAHRYECCLGQLLVEVTSKQYRIRVRRIRIVNRERRVVPATGGYGVKTTGGSNYQYNSRCRDSHKNGFIGYVRRGLSL